MLTVCKNNTLAKHHTLVSLEGTKSEKRKTFVPGATKQHDCARCSWTEKLNLGSFSFSAVE